MAVLEAKVAHKEALMEEARVRNVTIDENKERRKLEKLEKKRLELKKELL
jgi:hypothetical protein